MAIHTDAVSSDPNLQTTETPGFIVATLARNLVHGGAIIAGRITIFCASIDNKKGIKSPQKCSILLHR